MHSHLLLLVLPALAQELPAPGAAPQARPLRGHVDWQGHPAIHIPYRFFQAPFQEREPRRGLRWRHMLRQTVHAPYLRRSGVRVFVAAALAAEKARSREEAFALIEAQLQEVEAFVAANQADFALARCPQEARELLTRTDKIVIVHSIEGMARVLACAEDARRWAARGVVVATLVHLRDDEFGGAGVNPGLVGTLINPRGVWRDLRDRERGLTPHGRQAIRWLHEAGVLVDLTHMHPQAVDDALEVCRAHGIPPVVTHGQLAAIRDTQRGFSDRQVREIYRLGGTFALPISGVLLDPRRPRVPVPEGYRPGTLDAFQLHAGTLARLLRESAPELLGRPWERLSEAERTRLSFGWSSDWNGFVNHSRPTGDGPLEIDTRGLAHPGLLPQYWQRLEEQGLDLDPLLRAPEVFLDLWTRVTAR